MPGNDVETTVATAVLEIARRTSPQLTEVRGDQRLVADLGLESLDVAELVAVLENELGVDPFAVVASIADIRTVGDLIAAYRAAGTA